MREMSGFILLFKLGLSFSKKYVFSQRSIKLLKQSSSFFVKTLRQAVYIAHIAFVHVVFQVIVVFVA